MIEDDVQDWDMLSKNMEKNYVDYHDGLYDRNMFHGNIPNHNNNKKIRWE